MHAFVSYAFWALALKKFTARGVLSSKGLAFRCESAEGLKLYSTITLQGFLEMVDSVVLSLKVWALLPLNSRAAA